MLDSEETEAKDEAEILRRPHNVHGRRLQTAAGQTEDGAETFDPLMIAD